MNNLKVWPDEIFKGLVEIDENAKQMGNELWNMWGESMEGAAEWDKPIGVSALLLCQIKTPFWASKTPAAAVSPMIKMPLSLPSPSDFNYKYL